MSGLRLSRPLRELRIHLCQKGESSSGVREFLNQNYVSIKKANPRFPILVRECSGIQPRLWVRLDKGCEQSVSLSNLSAADVMGKVCDMAKLCGK